MILMLICLSVELKITLMQVLLLIPWIIQKYQAMSGGGEIGLSLCPQGFAKSCKGYWTVKKFESLIGSSGNECIQTSCHHELSIANAGESLLFDSCSRSNFSWSAFSSWS
jgi:hypothetical protein